MPGPVVTPTATPVVNPAAPVVKPIVATDAEILSALAPAPVVPEIVPPQPVNAGSEFSTNVAGSVTMPPIVYKAPKVYGQEPTDRGDKAEFLVLHAMVGKHLQGSRVTLADLGGKNADVPRLIELGAIAELAKPEPPADETPAPSDTEPPKKGK